MSLRERLAAGPLRWWCADRLGGVSMLTASLAAIARQHEPLRLPQGVDEELVAAAFRQRVAWCVQHAPPYRVLAAWVRTGVVSPGWAHTAAAAWPSHAPLSASQRARAWAWRPTATGWRDLGQPSEPARGGPVEDALTDLQVRMVRYLAAHAPSGTVGPRGAEVGLARICWTAAVLERDAAVLLVDDPATAVHQLRSDIPDGALANLVDLAALFGKPDSGAAGLRRWAGEPATGAPLGIVNPVIVPGWACRGLLVGETLLTVFTDEALDPEVTAPRLWELLASAWLDTEDRFQIRYVGVYLARFGRVQRWGLRMLIDQCTGSPRTRSTTREEFLSLAATLIRADGGQPPPSTPDRAVETPPWSQ
ncbi:hypothetical protein MOQ72_41440 [Saccharopolyspora sp. K220]|uniref:hypothetical protein n=1 Tax=Saccharopolyspora soli TaxID=2926618 RepID=UPI001F59CB6D|nr:hypothetical protein [Saccharopolyspora soli]MCI2423884.1 hypothetical protein [Saccharopolyspora soli]